jgi:septum site-determining protein MinC
MVADKQDVFFKGVKEGLHLTLNGSRNFDELKELLSERLKSAEFFFQGSDVILDTGETALSLDQILEIQHILMYPYGLRLKKVVRAEAGQPSKGEEAKATPRTQERTRERQQPHDEAPEPLVRSVSRVNKLPETLLYRGTLRSGQRIAHEGNVVILGEVNPGAEIRATGDIVVMGSLRGLAHAGASGEADAVVVAFSLAPTQLRIADVIARPPEEGSGEAREPEVARLKDGMIVVEPLEGTRWEGER